MKSLTDQLSRAFFESAAQLAIERLDRWIETVGRDIEIIEQARSIVSSGGSWRELSDEIQVSLAGFFADKQYLLEQTPVIRSQNPGAPLQLLHHLEGGLTPRQVRQGHLRDVKIALVEEVLPNQPTGLDERFRVAGITRFHIGILTSRTPEPELGNNHMPALYTRFCEFLAATHGELQQTLGELTALRTSLTKSS